MLGGHEPLTIGSNRAPTSAAMPTGSRRGRSHPYCNGPFVTIGAASGQWHEDLNAADYRAARGRWRLTRSLLLVRPRRASIAAHI